MSSVDCGEGQGQGQTPRAMSMAMATATATAVAVAEGDDLTFAVGLVDRTGVYIDRRKERRREWKGRDVLSAEGRKGRTPRRL